MFTNKNRCFRSLRSATWFTCLLGAIGAVPAQDPTQDLDLAIEKNRKGLLVIEAPPGTEVEVEQQRHEFWFGAALANQVFSGRMRPEDREQYLRLFLTNFNAAVTENALKWHDMEPRRGSVNYQTVDAILAWTDQHRIPLRGHNIFWGIPNRVQPWLKELDDDALRETLKNRALDIGRRYRGRFAEYDLNNEMIHGNYYEQRLGKEITLQMAQWVRQGDSNAVLYLNDYDILTGARLEDYLRHIRGLLDQGVPIGGIGVQGHLHGDTFDPKALRNALEKLSQFKLPIRVTEFNMPGQRSRYYQQRNVRLTGAEEQAKARALADYYRICFACPQVEGILMWGFWEGANWIPCSSLYQRDWKPLPAAEAYRDLVFRQWWTRWQGRTDAQGRCEVRAFHGQHRVKAGGVEQLVALRKSDGSRLVSFSTNAIDAATIEQWSRKFLGWHYWPDHVIPAQPNVPGHEKFANTDVPCVFQLPGQPDKWYMSFIGFNGLGYNSFVAESTDLVKWTNPRLAMGFGPTNEFDHGGCVIGAFLYDSYDLDAPRLLKKREGKYWTLYGCYPRQGGYELRPGYEGVACSADGLTWQRAKNQPILAVQDPDRGDWEKDCVYQPWLVEHQGRFYNFYNAAHGGKEQMGLARSADLLTWNRYQGNPVVRNRAGGYDAEFCSDGKVFRDGDHWVMFYFGVGRGGAHIMAAFSRDLVHWTARAEPLYQAGGHPGGLDKQYAHKISLVRNPGNDTYYLYYCACGNKGRGIGLITSKPLK